MCILVALDGCGIDLRTQLWAAATSQPGGFGGEKEVEGGERASETVLDCFYLTRNIIVHCFRNCVHTHTHGSSDVSLSNSG